MMRTRSLVACGVAIGMALTFFIANAHHDGFVPETVGNHKHHPVNIAETPGPAGAIAHLPKLAPLKAATAYSQPAIAPTVIELEPRASEAAPATEYLKQPEEVTVEPVVLVVSHPASRGSKTAFTPPANGTSKLRQFVSTAGDHRIAAMPVTTQATVARLSVPLPVRVPREIRALQHVGITRSILATDIDGELPLDPAISAISDNPSTPQLRKHTRRTRPGKQLALKTTTPNQKARRHRDPFDDTRN